MFTPKNTLIALAVAMLVAACGGGGGSSSPTPTGTNQTGNNNQQTQTPTNNTAAVTDVNFAPQLTLVNNQVLFDAPQDLAAFDGTTPNTDPGAPPAGIYGQARGTNAPLKTFGLRLMADPATSVTGNGHIAIELVDASGAPQKLQLMIDQVNYAIDAAGKWTVSVPATAKLYVHGVSSGGTADVITTIPADASLVTLTDNVGGDPTSHGLIVDIDKAVGLAKTAAASDAAKTAVLNTFGSPDFKGTFNMNAVYSALKINTQTGTNLGNPEVAVTVGSQAAVKGAGVKGKFTPL